MEKELKRGEVMNLKNNIKQHKVLKVKKTTPQDLNKGVHSIEHSQ